MAGITVTGLTAEKMLELADEQIIDGEVDGDSNLILTTRGGTEINAGAVGGATGADGPAGPTSIVIGDDATDRPTGVDRTEGLGFWQKDVKLLYIWNGTAWQLPDSRIPHTSVSSEAAGDDTFANDLTPAEFSDVISKSFTKYRDDTKVIATYDGTVWNNNDEGEYIVYVHVDGDDYELCVGFGSKGPKSGTTEITGLDAGTYTFSLRRKRGNGVGTGHEVAANILERTVLTLIETF